MKSLGPHIAYEELKGGHVLWSLKQRDYFFDGTIWREPDMRKEQTINGVRVFSHAAMACGINMATGEIWIADRRDLNKRIKLDLGVSIPEQGIIPTRDYIDIQREVTKWGAGSGFRLRVHPRGLKFTLKFTDRALIPPEVSFGLTAHGGLSLSGRRVMDGSRQAFRMPDLVAWAASDPDNMVDVQESVISEKVFIDLSGIKTQLATMPIIVDPSFDIQPATQDTFNYKQTPSQNYSTGTAGQRLQIYGTQTNSLCHSFLSFDISSIPANHTVTSASLVLDYYNASGLVTGETIYLRTQTHSDWAEGALDWNNYKAGSSFSTPGGDYLMAGQGTLSAPASYGFITIPATDVVDGFIGSTYADLILMFLDAGQGLMQFRSSNYTGDISKRPELLVETAIQAGVPLIAPPLRRPRILQ